MSAYTHPMDDRIRRLEDELDQACRTVLHLMPENVRELLESYPACESRNDTHRWGDTVAEQVTAFAKALPPRSPYSSDRAYCPLCGEGSQSPYESGFSLPEGLRRHLIGYGNTHLCSVMRAALYLARQHWDYKFQAAEQKERAEAHALTAHRRKTEMLYRVAPDLEPKLLDDGLHPSWSPARSADELTWAEARLATLGFRTTIEDNVKSYTREYEAFVVYADPREKGRIEFTPYKRQVPKRSPHGLRLHGLNGFKLMDSWKNAIEEKYEVRLDEAVSRM